MKFVSFSLILLCLVYLNHTVLAKEPKKEQPNTSYLEKWEPSKKDKKEIIQAVRREALKGAARKTKIDEVEWIGPYRWKDQIKVIWLRYKYVKRHWLDGPTVKETLTAFHLRSRGALDGGLWEAHPISNSDFHVWAQKVIASTIAQEKAEALLTGKKVEPGKTIKTRPRKPATKTRTWTSSSGKFTVTAELLDFRSGKVTLLTTDGRAIRLELTKLSKADRAYVRLNRD